MKLLYGTNMIEYKGYTIQKQDDMNWTLTREDTKVPMRDIKNPKTQKVIHPQGHEYKVTTMLGFFPDVGSALSGLIKNYAGTDCNSIQDLADQIREIRADLRGLVSMEKDDETV